MTINNTSLGNGLPAGPLIWPEAASASSSVMAAASAYEDSFPAVFMSFSLNDYSVIQFQTGFNQHRSSGRCAAYASHLATDHPVACKSEVCSGSRLCKNALLDLILAI